MSSSSLIITNDVGIRKEERRKSVGVVHHLTFLQLEAKQIQEDCIIAVQKDIIRLVLVLISHVRKRNT